MGRTVVEHQDLKELVLAALANPEDERSPSRIEEEAGLPPGTIADWLKSDPEFRRRLKETIRAPFAASRDLERLHVLKSLAAKAKQGSIQHQKFYLQLLNQSKPSRTDKLVVELIVTDAPEGG